MTLAQTLSWLPLETAGSAIVELLFARNDSTEHATYHVENPVRQDWAVVMKILSECLGLPLTEYDQWLELIQSLDIVNPLTEFFESGFTQVGCGFLRLDTTLASRQSRVVRTAAAVEDSLVRKYAQHACRDLPDCVTQYEDPA